MTGGAVIRRWSKVADATAVTARETLQRALGLGKRVRGVARSEVFSFGWNGVLPAAPAALETLARDTNLILNPNKHHRELVHGTEPLHPTGNAWVLVFEPGQGKELGGAINRRRLLPFPLAGVRSAVLWELDLEGDAGQIRAATLLAAETRNRRQGLLANPHFQTCRIMEAVPTAQSVQAALWEGDTAQ